jgi:hypothetical protein
MPLADGPAMYFGGTIMTFALPLGAFIAITIVLFFLFRSAHSGPKLKYLQTASFASVGTREPGPAPAPPVATVAVDTAAEPEMAAEPGTTAEPEPGE